MTDTDIEAVKTALPDDVSFLEHSPNRFVTVDLGDSHRPSELYDLAVETIYALEEVAPVDHRKTRIEPGYSGATFTTLTITIHWGQGP